MARNFTSGDDVTVSDGIVGGVPLTVACWFSTTTNAIQDLAACVKASTQYFWIGLNNNFGGSEVRARHRSGGTTTEAETTTGIARDGSWEHACGVFASTTDRRAFLNGGSKGTNTDSVSDVAPTSFTAGDAPPFAGLAGRIAEIGIWDIALSDAEVALLAAGISPTRIQAANLVGYWPLWGADSPEPDLSGDGANLTVTGATQADHAPVMPAFGFDYGLGILVPIISVGPSAGLRTMTLTGTGI